MNIDKALSHFKYKLTNSWKPTPTDIKAYNAILDYKELQESDNLSSNESLAKLWIHQLVLLSNTNAYSGKRSIQVLDEILDKSVYDWCITLKNQLPLMRFNNIGLDKFPIGDLTNRTEQLERSNAIVSEFETELTEALKYSISEKDCIKFVEQQINRVINKYEK